MLIEDTILGLLNGRKLSGYDLKKLIMDAPYMIWSGNNNQIYKALLQLGERGLVTSETVHQEGAPSKKVYTITETGQSVLQHWLAAAQPELPELRKPFLIQLALAARTDPARLEPLLEAYFEEVDGQRRMQQERQRRQAAVAARMPASARMNAGAGAAATGTPESRLEAAGDADRLAGTEALDFVEAAINDNIDRTFAAELEWARATLKLLRSRAEKEMKT